MLRTVMQDYPAYLSRPIQRCRLNLPPVHSTFSLVLHGIAVHSAVNFVQVLSPPSVVYHVTDLYCRAEPWWSQANSIP